MPQCGHHGSSSNRSRVPGRPRLPRRQRGLDRTRAAGRAVRRPRVIDRSPMHTADHRLDLLALKDAWCAELAAARTAQNDDDFATSWSHLERAHILSQPMAWPHVRTHLTMLRYGILRRDRREVIGQLIRLLVAAPG